MSHSKVKKKGYSLYVDKWNPIAKNYINSCYLCNRKGYSPALEKADFLNSLEHEVIYKELTSIFDSVLALDSYGRCEECAKEQDGLRR